MKVTVDHVPWFWKPAFWLYGYGLGGLFYIFIRLLYRSCRIEIVGDEHLKSSPNRIYAAWHNQNMPTFVANFFRGVGERFVLINHSAWYMKPVHLSLALLGVERLIMGSTGHGGRAAADEVVAKLIAGWSTHINPDGPNGPPRVLRKGALHMAVQSGIPIIAVQIFVSRELVLTRTWDGKRYPLPFSKLTIKLGPPIYVTESKFGAAEIKVRQELG